MDATQHADEMISFIFAKVLIFAAHAVFGQELNVVGLACGHEALPPVAPFWRMIAFADEREALMAESSEKIDSAAGQIDIVDGNRRNAFDRRGSSNEDDGVFVERSSCGNWKIRRRIDVKKGGAFAA